MESNFLKDLWSWILLNYGVIVMIIGVVSLVYGVIKDREAKKYKSLTLKPGLTQLINKLEDVNYCYALSIILINNGLGPAHIEKFEITVDGKAIQGEGVDLIEKVAKSVVSDYEYNIIHKSYLSPGYIMAASEKMVICSIIFMAKTRFWPSPKDVENAIKRTAMNIHFKSVDGKQGFYTTENKTKK